MARACLKFLDHEAYVVTVGVAKPAALPLADSAEIVITRTLADLPGDDIPIASRKSFPTSLYEEMHPSQTSPHGQRSEKIYAGLAIGSNLGDKFRNIELALRMLEEPPDDPAFSTIHKDKRDAVTVVDTSFMYETAPMYVVDQPSFINCACLVSPAPSTPWRTVRG